VSGAARQRRGRVALLVAQGRIGAWKCSSAAISDLPPSAASWIGRTCRACGTSGSAPASSRACSVCRSPRATAAWIGPTRIALSAQALTSAPCSIIQRASAPSRKNTASPSAV
jgi:hypothetical protein